MNPLSMIMLFFLLSLALHPLPYIQAADQHLQRNQTSTNIETVTLTGKVIDIAENKFVIKDTFGIKWEFQVDESTEQIGHISPGVMVTAEVESNGHARKVKILGKGYKPVRLLILGFTCRLS